MTRAVYWTASTLTGHIADEDNSLTWLFAVPTEEGQSGGSDEAFVEGVGALVLGSTTYEWVVAELDLLAQPQKWQEIYDRRPTFVFTTRDLPRPAGLDLRFVSGPVTDHLPEIHAAAAGRDIWVMGGGDLAGQFLDADALDEIVISLAPVALPAGAPLLPRRVESDRLHLDRVERQGQLVRLVYAVRPGTVVTGQLPGARDGGPEPSPTLDP